MVDSSEKEILIAELRQLDIKHNPEQIVRIARQSNGTIVFLETGNIKQGLIHIQSKAEQFASIGIELTEIPEVVMVAVTTGKIVGYQGKKSNQPRPIYELTFKGKILYLSVTVANNGYIVGANPRTRI
jgi:hypothetical protein